MKHLLAVLACCFALLGITSFVGCGGQGDSDTGCCVKCECKCGCENCSPDCLENPCCDKCVCANCKAPDED